MSNYRPCVYIKEGNCFNAGIRNGQNSFPCIGYDRCQGYKVAISRIDNIGQNGNTGEHYGSVCAHDWKYYGHGHNYSVYKCTICGAEEER